MASSMIDSAEGSCPYLTKDNSGNIVLSWIRSLNDSSFQFCYAISADGGKSFGKAVAVYSSMNIHPHSENIPKIIFKPSGEILALWGAGNPNPKNPYSGLIYLSQSFDYGKTWTQATRLVTDTAGYDQRYFDVSLKADGEAAIIWLDNRKKTNKEGSSLYFAATHGSNGFKNEKLIAEPCCECCRTVLCSDKHNNIHVLYRAILNDSIRDMVYTVSMDGGKTFQQPKKISNDNWVIKGCPHSGPSMTAAGNGMHMAWFTGGNPSAIYYSNTTNNGSSFSLKDSISIRGKHPQINSLPNGDLCMIWDEQVNKDDKVWNRIGLEIRSPGGETKFKQFITPDTCYSTYPVVIPVGTSTALAAYNKRISGKNHVYFQLINLD
jgi:hypothetical protein